MDFTNNLPDHSFYPRLRYLVEYLHFNEVNHIILCPGSRSAPLAMSVLRSHFFKTFTVVDERVAGFMALGMAKESKKPACVVTTSGTAVNNLSPSCSEAYFSNVPLIYLTADRPLKWVGQQDNQAIYQDGIFGKNIGLCTSLQTDKIGSDFFDSDTKLIQTSIDFAFEKSLPVHLNFPFEEPFYPNKEEELLMESKEKFFVFSKREPIQNDLSLLQSIKGKRILLAGGMSFE